MIFAGSYEDLLKNEESLTAAYLSQRKAIPLPARVRKPLSQRCIKISGARANNLKHIDVDIPLSMRLLRMLRAALRLRCPRCGVGKLYAKPFKMFEHCPHCQLKFEREQGYFVGAMSLSDRWAKRTARVFPSTVSKRGAGS